jgi:hypothetical protein
MTTETYIVELTTQNTHDNRVRAFETVEEAVKLARSIRATCKAFNRCAKVTVTESSSGVSVSF